MTMPRRPPSALGKRLPLAPHSGERVALSEAKGRVRGELWQSFKRQSIQEAVIRLMCREGLDSVTMERVAKEVGIAKGTVYLHYHDKKELLDAVKESSLSPLTAK